MHDISTIKGLYREEKLKMMEALWEDLLSEEKELKSPDWHADSLRQTEKRLKSGKEKLQKWSDARKKLRKRFE